ncbi:actin binding protein [Heterostelium album PN500]|uniref:Coactosin n=1 Tax=Heterostelium pallidum (strain ATCC 26659 / Pp 5 / PN500) TaxID=670386 RepID=D3BS64_HETP5|nr:actin binding protein [Heterostelium album PN500]EFA75801.1 actin binding protein [Heterostelium album PN500]|eukprot:XP_020427935.1 actin binding protein [Heterostelium album PN500]
MADVSDPQLEQNYQKVLSDADETNWCVFGYDASGKNIVFQAAGTGGIEELKGHLAEDQCQYAYLRVISGDAESKRAKFVFISWCGEGVGALKRAKMSVHKASVKKVIKNYGVEAHFTNPDEVNENEIATKIKKASGADYSGNSGSQ